ncbi:MAG: GlsB/YeaQ/YmgE family stress response membrane protein [Chloroflexi bacterium]|nr:GlsB/YeaQ/YmgE family stress response membrane protein [Chloroflexota bacterium]
MGTLTWILVGLIAGLAAQFLLGGGPGGSGLRGILITIALGVGGALVGGFISTALGYGDVTGFNLRSMAIATGGAVLVLFAWRQFAGRGGQRRFS